MNPASETMRITNPMTRSGVWRNFSQVVLLLAIHSPAPMIGMDANSVRSTPIQEDDIAATNKPSESLKTQPKAYTLELMSIAASVFNSSKQNAQLEVTGTKPVPFAMPPDNP
nr:hypothetical protein CR513_49382 [Ipomoea trifida]